MPIRSLSKSPAKTFKWGGPRHGIARTTGSAESAVGPVVQACHGFGHGYVGDPMVEPGLVTLAKIVGTLLLAMGVIPFLFLLSPGGDRSEPKDNFEDLN